MRAAVVDIGGTSIKSGIWEAGQIGEVKETDTNAGLGGEHVMQTVLEILGQYGDFQAVGISTAGQVDVEKGSILFANENIPGYTGMQIRERIEKKFHVPTAVQNDVNSAAIGEAYYGAGKGAPDFLCLTYGTGVGGAIVMNGEVYTGSGYSAGEFGGIVTHPEHRDPGTDIFSGCYERYASTTALVQRVKARFPELHNGREIFAQLHFSFFTFFSDFVIFQVVSTVGRLKTHIAEIVYGLTTLVHIFNPSLAVLGGGIMEQEYVIRNVQKLLQEHIMPSFRNVRVVQAGLGNKAGMLGAAWAACREYEKKI